MSKSIAILLLCLFMGVLGIPEEMQELIDTLHHTCQDETGAAEEVIQKAQKGDFLDDEKLKCYMRCILEQMACIDDNGIIDIDATVALLPEEYQEKGEKIIRGCGTKMGANPCDNAYLTNKCWYESSPDDYLLA